MPLAEPDAASGRRWKSWETVSIRAVDTVGIEPLRLRVWRLFGPENTASGGGLWRWPVGCPAPLRCLSQPTPQVVWILQLFAAE